MNKPVCLVTLLWVPLLGCLGVADAQSVKKMYWSDRIANTIRRADLDGTNVETLVSGLKQVRGIAIDFENDMLYWADNGTDLIQRSRLDGSNVQTLVDTGLSFPAGIDIDVAGGKIYWADAQTDKIQRANLDGSDVEDLVDSGLGNPYFVRLDPINGHVYWTDFGTDKIQRANLDGSNVVDLVTTGLSTPRGLDVDLKNGKIYWADRGTDVVQRSNLDGSQIETLVELSVPGVDPAPHGVALDVPANHLYWVDNGTVKIQRATLDGQNVTDLLTAGPFLVKPWEVLLDLHRRGEEACDMNQDGSCDAGDIDDLARSLRAGTHDPRFDLTGDALVSGADHRWWVRKIVETDFGDATLDGRFDSKDLIRVFQAGEFEDSIPDNSSWSEGDWNGDGDFDSGDMLVAFQSGSYLAAAQSVPEPAAVGVLWIVAAIMVCRRRATRGQLGEQIGRQ